MTARELSIGSLFEGEELLKLYGRNPDPLFLPESISVEGEECPLFHGKIPLSAWLKSPIPLPSVPVSFWGSPVTDLFPFRECLKGSSASHAVKAVESKAVKRKSLALVVKDLPSGDPLEGPLMENGFVPVDHDPIWYTPVYPSLEEFLKTLSKGRRKGLEGRWKRFKNAVTVRPALIDDAEFIKKSYNEVRSRSEMRLEELTEGFFAEAVLNPYSRVLVFEKEDKPFAFIMLWQKGDIWFDKYMGTLGTVHRDVSFYSMSILYLLYTAPSCGIRWYVAGQGCGEDKKGLGLKKVDVRLWIKPLLLRAFLSPLLKRFMKAHRDRVYSGGAERSL